MTAHNPDRWPRLFALIDPDGNRLSVDGTDAFPADLANTLARPGLSITPAWEHGYDSPAETTN